MSFYLLLALAFLLFHLLLLPLLAEDASLPIAFKGLAAITSIGGFAVFSILASVFLGRLYSKAPYLVISAEGVYDNASGMFSGAGWIAWSEIADVRLSRYHNLPCVELVPKDRARFLRRFSWLERINRSSRLGYPSIGIRGPLLPLEPSVLFEQMQTYWRSAPDTQARP